MAYWFQISANSLTWPKVCACCCGPAEAELRAAASRTTGIRVQTTTTRWWAAPYCFKCIEHTSKFDGANWWVVAGIVLGIGMFALIGLGTSSIGVGAVAAAATVVVSLVMRGSAQEASRRLMLAGCASAGSSVQYLEWNGTFHTFVFSNKAYLEAFLLANARKGMSDVRQV